MQLSDLPPRFPIPFANNAGGSYIRSIPQAHVDPTLTDAPASLYDGFPPPTFTQIEAGGIPPNGKDFNGILFQLSAGVRWLQAGGAATYNSTFSTAAGGYPKGARLMSSVDPTVEWISTADNNTTDPDGMSAANWAKSPLSGSLLANPGYFNIGGLIVQFGTIPITTGANNTATTVTFAERFPTECLGAGGWQMGAANPSWHPIICSGEFRSVTGFTLVCDTANVSQAITNSVSAFWLAAGW